MVFTPKNKKLTLDSHLQTYQILSSDDQMLILSLSYFISTVLKKGMFLEVLKYVHTTKTISSIWQRFSICNDGCEGRLKYAAGQAGLQIQDNFFIQARPKAHFFEVYSKVKNPKVGSFFRTPEDFEGLRSRKEKVTKTP